MLQNGNHFAYRLHNLPNEFECEFQVRLTLLYVPANRLTTTIWYRSARNISHMWDAVTDGWLSSCCATQSAQQHLQQSLHLKPLSCWVRGGIHTAPWGSLGRPIRTSLWLIYFLEMVSPHFCDSCWDYWFHEYVSGGLYFAWVTTYEHFWSPF